MKKAAIFLVLFFLARVAPGQPLNAEVDSIVHLLSIAAEDSGKVNLLNHLSKDFWLIGRYDKALSYANQALLLAQQLNFKKGQADAYNNIGGINIQQSNYTEALKDHLLALGIRKEIGDKETISHSYINIGNVYLQQGNYPEASKNYFEALKIGEEISNTGIIANSYCSIANVYTQQENYDEALKNYFAALKIWQKGDGHGVSMAYINIGNIYSKQGYYAEALKNFFAALDIQNNFGDGITLSECYSSIGNVYLLEGKYDESLKSYLKAIEYEKKLNYKYGIADSYINLGKIYLKLKKEEDAKTYLDKGLLLAKESGSRDIIKSAYGVLAELDSTTGNMTEAYRYYRLFTNMKDSITNAESNRQISQLKIQYESDKGPTDKNTGASKQGAANQDLL